MRQTIATYVRDGRTIEVDACFDPENDTDTPDFWEVWEIVDGTAICLSESGDPFYEKPAENDAWDYVKAYDEAHR